MSSRFPGAIILLYHRVTRPDRDPQLLSVSPNHFEQHLEILRRRAIPISLGRLVEDVRGDRVRDGSVALTFDDGYADNFAEAGPILQRADVPATIFATTAFTGTCGEFFWDELDRIFLSPGTLPDRLSLDLPGMKYCDDPGPPASGVADQDWNVLREAFPSERHRIYRDLCGLLHRQTICRRRAALEKIRQWAGVGEIGRESHRMMSAEEFSGITRDHLIEIGGHTVDHPVLSVEDVESQREQIVLNKQSLESMTGGTLCGFSYPFGTRHDFTPETVSLVKAAGYGYACANFGGRVTGDSDPYRLPRWIVRDWPGEEFERQLDRWTGSTV